MASLFVSSWFITERSNKYRKRGSINEDPVFSALSPIEFVFAIYECGMFQMNGHPYLAFSPDAVALLDLKAIMLPFAFDDPRTIRVNDKEYAFSSAEIKTVIVDSTV